MKIFNITMMGVGGQGIGLLSEVLLRAYGHRNLAVKGVDTHGLAQRGGMVTSHIRLALPDEADKGTASEKSFPGSPLIEPGRTDLLIALERTEALRGIYLKLRSGGTCLYYDAHWQSLSVRRGETPTETEGDLEKGAADRKIKLLKVIHPELADPRMQNMALLSEGLKQRLLPELTVREIRLALEDLMTGKMLESNLALFPAEDS